MEVAGDSAEEGVEEGLVGGAGAATLVATTGCAPALGETPVHQCLDSLRETAMGKAG